jgi:hypothetical protein
VLHWGRLQPFTAGLKGMPETLTKKDVTTLTSVVSVDTDSQCKQVSVATGKPLLPGLIQQARSGAFPIGRGLHWGRFQPITAG